MQQIDSDLADKIVKNERRGVWTALVIVVALASTLVVGSDTRRNLLSGVAVAIVFAVVWLAQSGRRNRRRETSQGRDAVIHDELRQAAVAAAYKGAFIAVLGGLALFCMASMMVTVPIAGPMLAVLTVVWGVTVFLGLFLLFDRD